MSEVRTVLTQSDKELVRAYNFIPFNLITAESKEEPAYVINELNQITSYYDIYNKGAEFVAEGTQGDYVAADLRYRLSYSLINKEARFLFGQTPDIAVVTKPSSNVPTPTTKENVSKLDTFINTILTKNRFEDMLLKAAKDCFIGKRVAALANFNEVDGITISFIPATDFVYSVKSGDATTLEKFVVFKTISESKRMTEKRIFVKRYELIKGKVYLSEETYDGTGDLVEEHLKAKEIKLTRIPAVVFLNDGLSGDLSGESEVSLIHSNEQWYGKLNSADIDSSRKSMNPIRYTVNMESNSTKNLSTSPGSYWDLSSDQNMEGTPQVGMLQSSLNHSAALNQLLDRIKTNAHDLVDVPNLSLESMQGNITSGKGLKAIYWPLHVRCQEKMKTWGPGLTELVDILIEGGLVFPKIAALYSQEALIPVDYNISVVQNTPILEDEVEEKQIDLSEVAAKTMSRKAYMKKWHALTDEEVEEELQQIAAERQILDEHEFPTFNDTSGILSEGE